MKKLITLLSAISIALISCQQNLVPDHPEIPAISDEVMTKSLSAGKITPDDPVVFLSETETDFWSQVVSLEDRFKAFEVPASRLSKMTTEALAKSLLNYPLNYLVLAYDNPQNAVDLIIENSPLHEEFLSRNDAVEVLVDLYAASDLDMSLDKSNYDGDYQNLSYTNMIFVEHLLGSGILSTLGRSSVKEKLSVAVVAKLQARLNAPEVFSSFSIEPLRSIDEAESLNVMTTNERSSVIYYETTIYTPWGQSIVARVYNERTSTELAQLTSQATSAHPDAIVRGPATQRYNSHSYTWHNQAADNNIWIETNYMGNNQVEKYWTDDLYEPSNLSTAEKAYYSASHHSAIPLSNGKLISKWGNMPLMEHESDNCPYGGSINYYKRKSPSIHSVSVQGQTPVAMNQTYTYNVSGTLPGMSLEWEVRFMDAPSPTPFILNVSSDSRSATLECQEIGYYNIMVKGYRNGIQMAQGSLGVVCLP